MEFGVGWQTRGKTKPCTCPPLEGEKEKPLGNGKEEGPNGPWAHKITKIKIKTTIKKITIKIMI